MRKKQFRITAYFDGCCEPINPGGTAAYGSVVFDKGVRSWETSQIFYPAEAKKKRTSNNVAEYLAFNSILDYLLECKLNQESIIVYGDSMLVICQMFGTWKMHGGLYIPHAKKASGKLSKFPRMTGEWIGRDKNNIADELSKRELRNAGVEFRLQPE